MGEYRLEATKPLGGYSETFGQTRLSEQSNLTIYSIAGGGGKDGDDKWLDAVASAFGLGGPSPTRMSSAPDSGLVWTAPDQVFLLLEGGTAHAPAGIASKLPENTYVTDQSDNWACLDLAGPEAVLALERICPLDLNGAAFPVGASARTAMEHLSVMIIRIGDDCYRLLSPRSSAGSFLRAIETSLRNVI